MKRCCKCGRELDEACFYKNKSNKDGLSDWCKECHNKCTKIRYEKNKDEILKKWNEYRKSELGSKARKETQKKYREKHHDEILEKGKKYREENKEKRAAYNSEYKKRYSVKQRERERLENDELYCFKQKMRKFVSYSFSDRRSAYGKNSKSQEIIGCSFEEAKAHLEQTWLENYGTPYNGEKIQIDHIIPLSSAKSKEEAIKLCHISNLQYLTPKDNRDKYDRLDWHLQ